MITKWFFQPDFADVPLFKLCGSASNFGYSLYGPNTQSPNLTLYALNTDFYVIHNWGDNSLTTSGYQPYSGVPENIRFKYKIGNKSGEVGPPEKNYKATTSYETGWFRPEILNAYEVTQKGQATYNRPVSIGRYNPEEDNGKGNRIWLTSIIANKGWAPPTDKDLIIGEIPLYMAFWGLWDYIAQSRKTEEYLAVSMFVVKSDYIKIVLGGPHQKVWPIIDWSFIQGKMPWDESLTIQEKARWYPTCYKQQQTINSFVECGPYCPKYTYLPVSTWQLPYKYKFYFKWGGPPDRREHCSRSQRPRKISRSRYFHRSNTNQRPAPGNTQKHSLDPGTSEGTLLQNQLLKECKKTYQLMNLNNLISQKHQKRKRKSQQRSHAATKRRKTSKHVSSHSAKKIPSQKRQKTSSSSSTSSITSSNSSRTTSSSSSKT